MFNQETPQTFDNTFEKTPVMRCKCRKHWEVYSIVIEILLCIHC